MTWETLATWLTLGITLALSILVPLFTQIANNKFQLKQKQQERDYELSQKRLEAYEKFLCDVGGLVTANGATTKEFQNLAGASLHRVYIYAPKEWRPKLDILSEYISNYELEKALKIMNELSHLIADELENKETNSKKKR